ncbi:MAG: hypothetical protein HZA35_00790 [Parcubacteria group bacterium]|nr:hypothetical protein [Parcubacteria group bacterium]
MALEITKTAEQEKLATLIDTLLQNEEDRELWNHTIPLLSDEDAQTISDVLNEDPSQLQFLTDNLKTKIEALKNGDDEAWDTIIEEETKHLESL